MLIEVKDLTFYYDGSHTPVFRGATFQFDSAWRLGFTGRNGRGKTTFLRCLMGELDYTGAISAPGLRFEYFPTRVPDGGANTLAALTAALPEAREWRLLRELARLGIEGETLERPFDTLSNGERTRAQLASLFAVEDAFPLIDEPTNHLDLAARELVGEYLAKKRGFILVSHDRALLDRCTDHTLSINRSDIQVIRGSFSTWWEQKQLRDRWELEEDRRLRGEISRLRETARERSQWSDMAERAKYVSNTDKADSKKGWAPKQAAKAAKQMRRVKALEKRQEAAIQEKSSLLKNLDRQEDLKLSPLLHRAQRIVTVRDLSVSYGPRQVFEGLSFELRPGDRLALTGPNGCGKSSVLKLLLGVDIPHTGEVRVASNTAISYVPQDTAGLRGTLADYAAGYDIDRSIFQSILRKLGFDRPQFERPLEDWSQGQKKKLLIARSLSEHAHLYIWDEPLNYIDVISRIQIEELISRAGPTMLFVEHDRQFTENIGTGAVDMSGL